MGKQYIYKGHVLEVLCNFFYFAGYKPKLGYPVHVASKYLEKSQSEEEMQKRLDAWAERKKLKEYHEPTAAEFAPPGSEIPADRLIINRVYSLKKRRGAPAAIASKLRYLGAANGAHFKFFSLDEEKVCHFFRRVLFK